MTAARVGAAPKIVAREAWLRARMAHLAKEKELTRLRDEVSRQRRELPWVRIEKEYVFEGPRGKATLAELFDGRSQLLLQHFMLGPGWGEGCKSCSFMADHLDAALVHLVNHDVMVVAVSRAPYAEIAGYRERMGWRFPWLSSFGSDFNYDYRVSFTEEELAGGERLYNFGTSTPSEELPGISVFARDEAGAVYHTYSTYGRGVEILMGTYACLDLTPKGRNEDGPMDWVRHHDRYGRNE